MPWRSWSIRRPRSQVPGCQKWKRWRLAGGARNQPAAIGTEAHLRGHFRHEIVRSQEPLEAASPQVPDPDPRLFPAADRQPAPIRADGDRPHAAILSAVQGRRSTPGRGGVARIDEHDPGGGVVDERHRPKVGQPRCPVPLVVCAFSEELGWPDPEGVRPVLWVCAERPTKEPPWTGADQALTVGMKQDLFAEAILEACDLPARVSVPQTNAVRVAGRQQPAVGTELARQHH